MIKRPLSSLSLSLSLSLSPSFSLSTTAHKDVRREGLRKGLCTDMYTCTFFGWLMKSTRDPVSQNRPRGRRTKDMPDGRQALLGAATRAFSRHGFEGADVRSIAAE